MSRFYTESNSNKVLCNDKCFSIYMKNTQPKSVAKTNKLLNWIIPTSAFCFGLFTMKVMIEIGVVAWKH